MTRNNYICSKSIETLIFSVFLLPLLLLEMSSFFFLLVYFFIVLKGSGGDGLRKRAACTLLGRWREPVKALQGTGSGSNSFGCLRSDRWKGAEEKRERQERERDEKRLCNKKHERDQL